MSATRPRAEIPLYIAASDICLMLLESDAFFETVLPSKMLEFMACEKPVIAGVRGLAGAIVDESCGGVPIAPEDHTASAAAISRFRKDSELEPKLSQSGRRYVLERFTREPKASVYLKILAEVVSP